MFRENPRNVYRSLTEEKIDVNEPPKKEDLENFLRPLFETQQQHEEHEWINIISETNETKTEMRELYITPEEATTKIKQAQNF